MAKRSKTISPDAGGSSSVKGSADSVVEFVPEIDKKPKVEKGTCDTCIYNRVHVQTEDGVRGICEIGRLLRGTTELPAANTCDHWEVRD